MPVLGIGALQVASRVQALLDPAPRPRPARLAVLVTLSLLVLLIGGASLARIHEAIEGASPYLRARR